MYDIFSVEETNLMCIFDISDRNSLLAELRSGMDGIYDPEMRDIFVSTIEKLESISDDEFFDVQLCIADDIFEDWEA